MESVLASLRVQIENENSLILTSLSREVQVASAKVAALESAVQTESAAAQADTVASTTLKQLVDDVEAKRRLYVELVARTGQMRIAAEQLPTAHVMFRAVPPSLPLHSFGLLSLSLGFIAGTIGAAGVSLLRTKLGSTVRSSADMSEATGVPVLGGLPDLRGVSGRTASLVSETLRALYLAMRSDPSEGASTIVVTSSEVGEGKTTVAMALARQMALDGFRVALIDADLRHPRLSASLNISPHRVTLESVLGGRTSPDVALTPNRQFDVDCLVAKGGADNPLKLLLSNELEHLIVGARQMYDFVILDSPPVLRVADATLLARVCRHVLFVVESGRMPAEFLNEAVHRFAGRDRAKVAALLTRVKHSDLAPTDYYGGYVPLRRTSSRIASRE